MMGAFWAFLSGLATIEGVGALFLVGTPLLARKIMGWRSMFFFATEADRDKSFPIGHVFRDRKRTVRAFFLSGRGVLVNLAKDEHNIAKALFPHPDSEYLNDLQEALGLDYDLSNEIRQMTKRARDTLKIAEVLWYKGPFPGFSLTFSDKSPEKGWVSIQMAAPHMAEGQRPILYLRAKKHPEVYRQFDQCFDGMWNESVEPSNTTLNIKQSGADTMPPLDYDRLRGENMWPMYRVSFMWHGVEPPAADSFEDDMTAAIEETHTMLSMAVYQKKLPASDPSPLGKRKVVHVRDADLIAFCQSKGIDLPQFLEGRGPTP